MRFRIWASSVLLSLMTVALSPHASWSQEPRGEAQPPPSGYWILGVERSAQDTVWLRFTLRFDRDSITGANGAGNPLHGVLRGDSVRFSLMRGDNGGLVVFEAVVKGDTMRGIRVETPQGTSTPLAPVPFVASPDVPSRAPRRFNFEPEVFHRVFSGAVSPVLRIVPGDTVRTWTVDNAGRDSTGSTLTAGGNPLTGPFFIEGALSGDVIAIRIHRLRLNRDFADAGDQIVFNAITPEYVRQIEDESAFNRRWRLDRTRGLAMLEEPTPRLRSFAVPLRPLLGCVGVAPPGGQVVRAQDSGPFGGNMDYNAIREGATVYLPVFQRGALLYIGDGHAVQGDGELTGDALETSLDVEFSVELLRQRRISTPRAEDPEFLMAIGISGDLTDALRQATTELSRWLEADYALSAPELASLLGVAIRYDVADLVGTQVSIVAKMPKAALRDLERTVR